jgi:hypothetical protein
VYVAKLKQDIFAVTGINLPLEEWVKRPEVDSEDMLELIIKEVDNKFKIYFINNWGRVFDELEFKKKKIAQRQLRKNGFDFSTNRFCPFIPPEPIYIKLSKGKKSAPYSKGNLWKKVQRNKKHFDKYSKKDLVDYLLNCGE